MNKRWISLLLAALMLLSLLPTAFAAQQPDGAQIDTAALAVRMNRSDSVRLSETASPKQSPVPTAAAKTADESKPNEIYPHPSQDGMGVLSPASRLIIILLMYAGRLGSLTFAILIAHRRTPAPVQYPAGQLLVG